MREDDLFIVSKMDSMMINLEIHSIMTSWPLLEMHTYASKYALRGWRRVWMEMKR